MVRELPWPSAVLLLVRPENIVLGPKISAPDQHLNCLYSIQVYLLLKILGLAFRFEIYIKCVSGYDSIISIPDLISYILLWSTLSDWLHLPAIKTCFSLV